MSSHTSCSLSCEEEAKLASSNKKVKGAQFATFNEDISTGNRHGEPVQKVSFKDKLVGEISVHTPKLLISQLVWTRIQTQMMRF